MGQTPLGNNVNSLVIFYRGTDSVGNDEAAGLVGVSDPINGWVDE